MVLIAFFMSAVFAIKLYIKVAVANKSLFAFRASKFNVTITKTNKFFIDR